MVLTVLSLNLANGDGTERTPFRFGLRFKAVADRLRDEVGKQTIDVLVLSELRVCKDAEGTGELHPATVAAEFAKATGFEIAILQPDSCHGPGCEWKLTMYNPRTCVHVGSTFMSFGKTTDTNILCSTFRKKDAESSIDVLNVHIPPNNPRRLAFKRLLECAEEINLFCQHGLCFVGGCCGETFVGLDEDESNVYDMLDMFDLDKNEQTTFVPFPHSHNQEELVLDHCGIVRGAGSVLSCVPYPVDHAISAHAVMLSQFAG